MSQPPSSSECPAAAEGLLPPVIARADELAGEWRWRRRLHGTILAVCLAVALLASVLEIRAGQHVVLPLWNWTLPETCSLRQTLGVPCPGCGMTRGFIALAHGDVRGAWSYNPAAIPLFTWLMLLVPYQMVQIGRLARGRYPLTMGRWAVVPLAVLTTLMFAAWFWRLIGG